MDWIEIEIGEVVQETPIDRRFVLRIPAAHAADFAFEPGQFVTVRDPAHPDSGQRAYSICSAPNGTGTLDVTVRDMGNFGHEFYGYETGTKLLAKAPQGRFVLANAPDDDIVMVGGGSGITPFRSYVGHLRSNPPETRVWLLQSSRTADQFIFRGEFEEAADACDWFTYVPTVTRAEDDDPWTGRRGRIDEALLRGAIRDPEKTVFHACGPGVFVKEMLATAAAIGVPKERCKKEQWG